jgi:hypothetical protein
MYPPGFAVYIMLGVSMRNSVKNMSAFETWQVITSIAQTAILLATLLAAIYIGLKQAEISKRQAYISETQTAISRSLADLPFVVSAEITYEQQSKRLHIYNKGQTNIYLWGTKLRDGPKVVEQEPRLVTPGGSYYLLAESLEGDLRKVLGMQPEVKGLFIIYLTSQNDVKYIVSTILLGMLSGDQIAVHTQTTSIRPEVW